MFAYKGVDISALQGNVDMVWLKNQGYSFIICRNYVGNDYRDAACDTNLQKAKAVGLKTGIYNFCFILPEAAGHINRNPEDQALLHFNNTPKDELVCVDLEFPAPGPDWTKWGVNATFIDDWVFRYLEKYKQLSGLSINQIVIYTYPNFAQSVKFRTAIGEYPLWYANYGTSPVEAPWTNDNIVMIQTSGGNKLTLPNGCPCDVNEANNLSLWNENIQSQLPTFTVSGALNPIEITPVLIQPTPTTAAPTTAASTNSIIQKTLTIFQQLPTQQIMNTLMSIVKTLLHIK